MSEKQSEDEKSNGLSRKQIQIKEMLEKADKKATESPDGINNEADAETQSASEDSTALEAKIEKKEENQPELRLKQKQNQPQSQAKY